MHIEQRYAKANVEFRDEYMQPDPARRSHESVKRAENRIESFYGDLEPLQQERLERWVADSPFDPNLTLEERRRRQQDALQTLRRLIGEQVDSATARAQIQGWVQRFGRSPSEPHRLYAERVVEHNCKLTADLHNSASPAQRKHVSKKLRAWAADLRALAADTDE